MSLTTKLFKQGNSTIILLIVYTYVTIMSTFVICDVGMVPSLSPTHKVKGQIRECGRETGDKASGNLCTMIIRSLYLMKSEG